MLFAAKYDRFFCVVVRGEFWKISQVTFAGASYMADYMEGTLPEFRCMNEHYGMEFTMGAAGKDHAAGVLTTDKVCYCYRRCCRMRVVTSVQYVTVGSLNIFWILTARVIVNEYENWTRMDNDTFFFAVSGVNTGS